MFEMRSPARSMAIFKSETGGFDVGLELYGQQINVGVTNNGELMAEQCLDYKSEEDATAAFDDKVKEARGWKVNQPDQPHDSDEKPEPEKPKTTRKPRTKAEPKPE